MTRQEIVNKLKNYFEIYELVGPKTYKAHGERSWKFFRTDALHALLITREGIGRAFTVNNWKWGGKFSQRGLRTNVQYIFRSFFLRLKLYLSGHVLGGAFDFDVEGMTADEVRQWILTHEYLYPMKIRLEHKKRGKPINWTHLDTIHEEKNPQVYLFDV